MISLETVKLTEHEPQYQNRPKENFDTEPEKDDFKEVFEKELTKHDNHIIFW